MQTQGVKQILTVGDWVVDEHWVVGKHRSAASSRTGPDHTRALNAAHACVRSLCGAGQVASVFQSTSNPVHSTKPFRVHGLGIWFPQDTEALRSMIDPSNSSGNTPHRLSNQPIGSSDGDLFNLAGDSLKTGTTRVIRIYRREGDKPRLSQLPTPILKAL